jgi:hypothetical protein
VRLAPNFPDIQLINRAIFRCLGESWQWCRKILNSFQAVFITALFSITFLDNDAGLAGLAITVRVGSIFNTFR